MKNDRNRASRSGAHTARRYNVSPVARAIRSVLTLSAAALAFSGTGAVLAKTPSAPPVLAAQRPSLADLALHQIPDTVADLTRVRDGLPSSVVGGEFDLHAALADGDLQFAGPVGPGGGDAIDRFHDLTTVTSLMAGPGGPSGSDDAIHFMFDNRGAGVGFSAYTPSGYSASAISNFGLADGIFLASDGNITFDNNGDWVASGYTWAAGAEVESGGVATVNNNASFRATASGPNARAIGIYAAGTTGSIINNNGLAVADSTGANGLAVGAWAYAVNGDASVSNTGDVYAYADNGSAFGLVAMSGDTAHANNTSYVLAEGLYAVAVTAQSAGNANVANDGLAIAMGDAHAEALLAISNGGSATLDNTSVAYAHAYGDAVAMHAIAAGNATATNTGMAYAYSYSGTASGIVASGDNAYALNDVGGVAQVTGVYAIGMDVQGASSALGRNDGIIDAWAIYDATGMNVVASAGNADLTQNGDITAYSYAGVATGGIAQSTGGDANAHNAGTIKVDGFAFSVGVQANAIGGGTATATNGGTINAFGIHGAYGVVALSDGDAVAGNTGNVSASSIDGRRTYGVWASGDTANASNSYNVTANSTYGNATGITATAYGDAIASNSGVVDVDGYNAATGVFAYSYAGHATAENNGGMVYADALGTAYGVSAFAVHGDASAHNSGFVQANAQFGVAVGVYANTVFGNDADVANSGTVVANGDAAGVGMFVGGASASATNDNWVQASASAGDGFAAGILAVGNDLSATNNAYVDVRGTYATGIDVRAGDSAYVANNANVWVTGVEATGISAVAAAEDGLATVVNDGNVLVTADGNGTGIQVVARGYHGDAHIDNTGNVNVGGAYASGALQGLVVAADIDATIHNSGSVNVNGGSAAYGALALSADGDAIFTNDGDVVVQSGARGGVAFGALVQSKTGISLVDNNNRITAIGDTAYAAYAFGQFTDATVDNAGSLTAVGMYGNAFGALSVSYNADAHVANSGGVNALAAGGALGLESLSYFGDADVTNDGFVYAGGGSRARGMVARSLYGDADTVNNSVLLAYSNGAAIGQWSRADFGGSASATNHGVVLAVSYYGGATGVVSGGYVGSTFGNDGGIHAYAAGTAIGADVYSTGGNATASNAGDVSAVSYGDNAIGINAGAYGDVAFDNAVDGDVRAYGVSSAIGANVYSLYGNITANNAGTLFAQATGDTTGLSVVGYYDATITNTGAISAISDMAYANIADGIFVNASNIGVTTDVGGSIVVQAGYWAAGVEARGDIVTVLNKGDITATAQVYAFGVVALGDETTVRNDGAITATSNDGNAYGELAIGNTNAITTNGGDILVTANNGSAYGTLGAANDVDSTNDGSILANGLDDAVGMAGYGYYHSILVNHGDINAYAHGTDARAAGLFAQSTGYVKGINDGSIVAHADNGTAFGAFAYGDLAVAKNLGTGAIDATVGNGSAIGLYAFGNVGSSIENRGELDASAGGGSRAIGALAISNDDATVTQTSTGMTDVLANNGAFGAGHIAVGDIATVNDAGATSVHGSTGQLTGIGSYGDTSATIDHGGDLAVLNGQKYDGNAIGLYATAYDTATAHNSGDISVVAGTHMLNSHGSRATGILGYTYAGTVTVGNDGTITVGDGFTDRATGIDAQSEFGDIAIDNSGQIVAGATTEKYSGGPTRTTTGAYGVRAYSYAGDVAITSSGSVDVVAGQYGLGLAAQAYYGNASVAVGAAGTVNVTSGFVGIGIAAGSEYGIATADNAGAIVVDATDGMGAIGVLAQGDEAISHNAEGGSITAHGGDWAIGMLSEGITTAEATNDGTITVEQVGSGQSYVPLFTPQNYTATGIVAYAYDGDAHATNNGDVSVSGTEQATGIQAIALGSGHTATVDNTGTITATGNGATGIQAQGDHVVATNAAGGNVTATGADWGIGMQLSGRIVDATNDGHLTAVSTADGGYAAGIAAIGNQDLAIANGGDISATAALGGAKGISGYGQSASEIDNTGSISVDARDYAIGIHGDVRYNGALSIHNGGDITASAQDSALGIYAVADAYAATVVNDGAIHATATDTAFGVFAYANILSASSIVTIDVGATGTIDATADRAFGVATGSGSIVQFDNAGRIDANGQQMAAGAMFQGAVVAATNDGLVNASASADDGQAIGMAVLSAFSSLDNNGDVHAVAANGFATGALLGNGYGPSTVENAGLISAVGGIQAVGLSTITYSGADIDNSGTIEATGPYAVGIALQSSGVSTVHNTGSIVATGALESTFAIKGDDGIEQITNAGDLVGAVDLGGGDDALDNAAAGTWIVRGHSTDFGAGDDHLVNAGHIVMDNAAISLGSSATAAGNAFDNTGTLLVNGDSAIDMGTGVAAAPLMANAAPVDVLNGNAFNNNGTISFLDGAPDDILTINGDFAGHGALTVDVSLLNQASDMLYVEGNVAPSAVQAINVNVLDMPKARTVEVPVVQVTGASTPDNFVAGDFIVGNVDFSQSNFLDLKVGVVQRPSSTGAQDMFALTLDFAGVNDTGALAASIVPGAHSLMAAQVGTFRQRMGVFSQLGNSDKGAWVRVFSDKGSIDPDQLAGNLPTTDNFGFDQRNSGIEAGVNALVTDGVFVGASLATAKGKQDLSNGVGSDDIDGDTIGGYLTWLSPNGMYADVSYRWMHFDADMSSFGGQRKVGGDVSAFNVEAGWDVWTSTGGLKLVPQVQYTHQEVQNVDRIQGELADFFTDGGTSERGRLGLSFQQTLKTANGSWTPYGTVSVIREFDGDSHFAIADNAFNGGSTTKGTSGMLELGADVNMGALHVYGGLNWTDGGAIDSVWGGQVGVRYTW